MNPLSSLLKNYRQVRQIPVFEKLNWYDIQRIASKSRIVHFSKGDVLYRQGDPPTGFYCLLSGRVQAYCLDFDGKKYDVEFFRRGMYFGIVSLLTGEGHSMNFEALNDSRTLFIPKDDFLAILKAVPQLNMEFSQSLSRRLQTRSRRGKGPLSSKIISVYSPRKAVGTSTHAFYLAHQIYCQARATVLLIRVASALPGPSSGTPDHETAPLEWKQGGRHLDEIVGNEELIRSLILSNNDGIDLLSACFYPDDQMLVSRISDFVTSLALEYNYIVVDLPNDTDEVVMKTLTQSDEIHLLAKDDQEELKMVRKVLNDLEEQLKQNFNPGHVRVLLKSQPDLPAFSFEQIRELIDYDIYARIPYLSDRELAQVRDYGAVWARFPNEEAPFYREMVKIAREVTGVRVGLVLGGGAALGVAHIGVLRVLERERITVDIIAGSSMGALVASLWATEYDSECLINIAQQFRDQKALLKLFDPVVPISGVIGGRLIKRWLHRFLGDKHFYDTRVPVKVVAYDLNNRQELVYDSGRLVDAVRKSISIPGVFEPVMEHDRVIIDGGVLNPVPINVLRDAGIHKIIAVNVLQSPAEVVKGYQTKQAVLEQQAKVSFLKSPVRFLKYRLLPRSAAVRKPIISDIMVQTLLASEYETAERSARSADVMIHPDLSGIQWYELYKVDELIRLGEEAAEQALPQIKALVNG